MKTPTRAGATATGASPTPHEAQPLLDHRPEELAGLAQEHPHLAGSLTSGFEAISAAGSEERAANQHTADSYYALTDKIVDGLFERLNQSGVADAEVGTIYVLLDKVQDQGGEKTTEFLKANDKTGSKRMLVVGLVLSIGLSFAFAVYAGERSSVVRL